MGSTLGVVTDVYYPRIPLVQGLTARAVFFPLSNCKPVRIPSQHLEYRTKTYVVQLKNSKSSAALGTLIKSSEADD